MITREEIKELLPIMEAYSKGKEIQIWDESKSEWVDLDEDTFIAPPDKYRIKTEPKYRPFKNQEECLQEMQKHQPFGWVKEKAGEGLYLIYCINNCIDTIYDINSFEEAINIYEFMDGTPFGVKED